MARVNTQTGVALLISSCMFIIYCQWNSVIHVAELLVMPCVVTLSFSSSVPAASVIVPPARRRPAVVVPPVTPP